MVTKARRREVFPLRKAYPFATRNSLPEQTRRIRKMSVSWDKSYTSTVRRGFMIELLQRRGLLEAFKQRIWRYGLTPAGQREMRHCLTVKRQFTSLGESK